MVQLRGFDQKETETTGSLIWWSLLGRNCPVVKHSIYWHRSVWGANNERAESIGVTKFCGNFFWRVTAKQINSQTLEETQVGYISQKYSFDKYTLGRASKPSYALLSI